MPRLFLVSSSLMKLRCEYYSYIFYLLTLIHTLVIILGWLRIEFKILVSEAGGFRKSRFAVRER